MGAKQAGAILVLAFAVRAAVPLFQPDAIYNDAIHYLDQADAIARGGWISEFPNGYPLLIAAVQRILPAPAVENTLVAVNVLLSTITVWCVIALARQWAPAPGYVYAAGLAAALWPNQLFQVWQIGTETIATTLLAASAVLWCRDRPGLAGLALGLATTCRTIFAPIAIAGFVIACAHRQFASASRFAAAALLPVIVLAGLGAMRGGSAVVDGNVPYNLIVANRSFGGTLVGTMDPIAFKDAWREYAGRLRREPAYFIRQRLAALWELWGPWPAMGQRGVVRNVLLSLRFPLLALGIAGWFHLRRSRCAGYLLAAVVVVTLGYTMFFALARFTAPVEPLLIALAGGMPLQSARSRIRRKGRTAS